MGGDGSSREYRVITDPSEPPKKFTLQTRVTSRGETAVILMGVDCAERVTCHASVGLDLPEGAFVFNVGPNTSGILDQLLAQGALKVIRVEHARQGPVPVCELTPGGLAQPAFEGDDARLAAAARRTAEAAAADASGDAFFDALRAEEAKAQQNAGQGAPPGAPGGKEPRGAPPGMGTPPPPGAGAGAGADILAMLNGGSPSPSPLGAGVPNASRVSEAPARTPPAMARQLMPRTTRGSTGGGARVPGAGGASHDDGFFDASAGAPSPASVTSARAPAPPLPSGPLGLPPGLSPLGGLGGGLFGSPAGGLFGGGTGSPAGGASGPFGAPPAKPPTPGGSAGAAGADILAALAAPGRAAAPPGAYARSPRGAPSNEDLLAMLGGGGDSAASAPPARAPPGRKVGGAPTPLSIDELEAEALASATKAAATKETKEPPGLLEEDPGLGALSADAGALGLGFLGITTDDDDFALPLRAAERKDAPAAPEETKTPPGEAKPAKPTKPPEADKADKETAREEKRERRRREKEEEKKRREEEAAASAAAAAAKASVTSYSSDVLFSLRAKCTSAPPEVDLEMFEHADKALTKRDEEKAEKAEKAERKKAEREKKAHAEPRASPPPSRSRSDDRLDEPAIGGALGLGFLGISSGSLAAMDEGGGEKKSSGTPAAAEKKDAPAREAMSAAEIAKALLAELRGLEDRVEVAGDESGPMVLLKLGSALEAIRDEPFKSI